MLLENTVLIKNKKLGSIFNVALKTTYNYNTLVLNSTKSFCATFSPSHLVIVEESAAGQVSSVAGKFAGHAHVALSIFQAVDGADVVEAAASDKAARRRVRTCHDPGRAQRDGVNLVGGVRVPYDQLAILAGRDKIP